MTNHTIKNHSHRLAILHISIDSILSTSISDSFIFNEYRFSCRFTHTFLFENLIYVFLFIRYKINSSKENNKDHIAVFISHLISSYIEKANKRIEYNKKIQGCHLIIYDFIDKSLDLKKDD